MAKYKAQPVYLDLANNQLLLPQEVKRLDNNAKKKTNLFCFSTRICDLQQSKNFTSVKIQHKALAVVSTDLKRNYPWLFELLKNI